MYNDLIIEAVKIGGQTLLELFGFHADCNTKESQSSIITQADMKVEAAIINKIKESFSRHNFIAEESCFEDNGFKFTWIVLKCDFFN